MRTSLRSAAPVITVSLLLAACAGHAHAPSAPHDLLGKPVELSLPTDRGALATVPAPGAATVVDFFGPTCVPCREKVPALVARGSDLEAAGAKLVLVAVLGDGETTEDARKALGSWGVTSAFLVDSGDASKREAGVRALPATLVLDRAGALRWSATPTASAGDVVAAVRALR